MCADKQKCWPHLLRDAAAVSEKDGAHPEWKSFSRRLVSVYRDPKKLHVQKGKLDDAAYDVAVARLELHADKHILVDSEDLQSLTHRHASASQSSRR